MDALVLFGMICVKSLQDLKKPLVIQMSYICHTFVIRRVYIDGIDIYGIMARKRDFEVKLKAPGKDDILFVGEDCEVKDKTLAAKLEIENPYKETIECKKYTFKKVKK